MICEGDLSSWGKSWTVFLRKIHPLHVGMWFFRPESALTMVQLDSLCLLEKQGRIG